MSISDFEKRITVLEDIEAIKQLKARYCAICDDDHNPDKIGSVFAEDGIWEGGDFGKAQGHAAIRKLFEGFKQPDELLGAQPDEIRLSRSTADHAKDTGTCPAHLPFARKMTRARIACRYEDYT